MSPIAWLLNCPTGSPSLLLRFAIINHLSNKSCDQTGGGQRPRAFDGRDQLGNLVHVDLLSNLARDVFQPTAEQNRASGVL